MAESRAAGLAFCEHQVRAHVLSCVPLAWSSGGAEPPVIKRKEVRAAKQSTQRGALSRWPAGACHCSARYRVKAVMMSESFGRRTATLYRRPGNPVWLPNSLFQQSARISNTFIISTLEANASLPQKERCLVSKLGSLPSRGEIGFAAL